MDRVLEIQLTFNMAVHPAATRALKAFHSARSRSDYLKSVLEAHFMSLQAGPGYQLQHGPHHPNPPYEHVSAQTEGGLNEHDVERTFSQYFPA